MEGRTDNDVKNKWNTMKRSQERQNVRSPPQVSNVSTEVEPLELQGPCVGSISPKKKMSKMWQKSNRLFDRLFRAFPLWYRVNLIVLSIPI